MGELDDQIHIIWLGPFQHDLRSHLVVAALAFVNDHVGTARLDHHANGFHQSVARVGAIAGVDVNVFGPETEGAMIAWSRDAGWENLFAAVIANKPLI